MVEVPHTQRPMLARLVRELPEGEVAYEPKWDGFRCLAFRERDEVDLRSRHSRPLGRYFPELTAALAALPVAPVVIDGEVLVLRDGRFDFASLMARLHPAASRVQELARQAPAVFVAFDLLAAGVNDLRERPFVERRARLEELLATAPSPLHLTPVTQDREVARRWLAAFSGAGLDGVVAKPLDGRYAGGARAMWKVKHERTADCVVAGARLGDGPDEVTSLMLGLYDGHRLEHIGVASSFSRATRRELAREVVPLTMGLKGHPWERGFLVEGGPTGRLKGAAGRWQPGMTLDWVPLAPRRVCEVAYTQLDGHRLRHPAKLVRWRPDREPSSCRLDQLQQPEALPAQLLAS